MLTFLDIMWRCSVGGAFLLVLMGTLLWIGGAFKVELLWVWRDLWIGVFASKEGPVYVCLLPTVVVKITPMGHP